MSPALFDALRRFGGPLSQAQVDGVNTLLARPEAAGWDRRWLSYAIATAWHETGGNMQPVREGFAKTDEGAIRAVTKLFQQGRISRNYAARDPETGQSYFGRGLVQLTHRENYARAGEALGLPLVAQPELALETDVSAAILLRGMAEGWFTGKRLADYFHHSADDPVNARRIVNGLDKADLIAGYHRRIVAALAPAPMPPADDPRVAQLERRVAALELRMAGIASAAQLEAGPI